MTDSTNFPWRNKPGPWQNEGDGASWFHSGLLCSISRPVPELGHWCGYVDIPKDHPWFGAGDDFLNAQLDLMGVYIHWGITHANQTEHGDCWRIGFDCAHSGDKVPGLIFDSGEYRTEEWVRKETEKLADVIYDAKRSKPMTDNPCIYIVYATPEDRNAYISGQYADMSEARKEAQDMARANPGTEFHIATRTSIFVAETVVKEK